MRHGMRRVLGMIVLKFSGILCVFGRGRTCPTWQGRKGVLLAIRHTSGGPGTRRSGAQDGSSGSRARLLWGSAARRRACWRRRFAEGPNGQPNPAGGDPDHSPPIIIGAGVAAPISASIPSAVPTGDVP